MKKMKNLFGFVVVLITLFVSCSNPAGSDNGSDNDKKNNNENEDKTTVVFNNTQGICAVTVYNDHRRRDEDKIAEVPAGRSSEAIECAPAIQSRFILFIRCLLKASMILLLIMSLKKSERIK